MDYLVDTNVLSELARRRPNPGVLAWAEGVSRIRLSVITVEEIQYGLAWKPNERVLRWFADFFANHCEVAPVSDPIARRAGRLRGEARAHGLTRTQADALIGATALEADLTLVTRNTGDFEGVGLALLNPFA